MTIYHVFELSSLMPELKPSLPLVSPFLIPISPFRATLQRAHWRTFNCPRTSESLATQKRLPR